MGVYIPNMEMPKNCFQCSFNDGIYCALIDNDTDAFIFEDPTEVSTKRLPNCPIIEIVQCKDCKWFELDVWGELNGIPLIVAHEMCKFWGNGCKTNPNGFCSYGEKNKNGFGVDI